MSNVPVNITNLLRDYPPLHVCGIEDPEDFSEALEGIARLLALYLINQHRYYALWDRENCLWVQYVDYMILPVGATRVLPTDTTPSSDELPEDFLSEFLPRISNISYGTTLPLEFPYAISIIAIYEGTQPSNLEKWQISPYLHGHAFSRPFN